jgi:hypothetical protein
LLSIARRFRGSGLGFGHGGRDATLLLGRELKNVVRQQFPMISLIAVEGWRSRPGEHPAIVRFLEKPRGHRGAGAHGLRIGDPALDPVGLETLFGQQEVWRRGDFVV